MMTKLMLTLISLFFITVGIYLAATGKKITGKYYDEGGHGWITSSFSGYFLIVVGLGFLFGLIYSIKKRNR